MIEEVCPLCNGRLPEAGGRLCPWCGAVLDGGESAGRAVRRAAIVGVVLVVAGVWAAFVPPRGWNATSGVVFGVVTLFLTAMAWVLSGSIVDD